jgi:hypothetical protein
LPLWYLLAGEGMRSSWGLNTFGLHELYKCVQTWVSLSGDAIFFPGLPTLQILTVILGTAVVLIQVLGIFHVLRLPSVQRERFMVPVILTIYSFLVFIEILLTRFNAPDVGFTPRYSTHMLGGVVSVMFWVVTLLDSLPWGRVIAIVTVTLVACGVGGAEIAGAMRLRTMGIDTAVARSALLSLRGNPTPSQQLQMRLTPAMVPLVYPGRLFLQDHLLALYAGDRASSHKQ